tara:strand:+ start:6847 stop:8703 length:1857 start_codon:yes stop_codon:yes gene_type:complete
MDKLTKEIDYNILNDDARDNKVFGWIKDDYVYENSSSKTEIDNLHDILYGKASTIADNENAFIKLTNDFSGTNVVIQLKMEDGTTAFDPQIHEIAYHMDYISGSTKDGSEENRSTITLIKQLYDFYKSINDDLNTSSLNTITSGLLTIADDGSILDDHKNMITQLEINNKDELNEKVFVYYNLVKLLFQKLQLYRVNNVYYNHLKKIFNGDITDSGSRIVDDESGSKPIDNLDIAYKSLINNLIQGINNSTTVLQQSYDVVLGLILSSKTLVSGTTDKYTFTIDRSTNSVLTQGIYSQIDKDKHIIRSNNNTYLIENVHQSTNPNEIIVTLDRPIDIADIDFRVNFKRAYSYKMQYKNEKDELKDLNKTYGDKDSELKKALISYEMITDDEYKLKIISYIFYVIFLFILIGLLLADVYKVNNDIKGLYSLIMLFIVIVLYTVYIMFYNGIEQFSTSSGYSTNDGTSETTGTNINKLTTNFNNHNTKINDKSVNYLIILMNYHSVIALNEVYLNIFRMFDKEKSKLHLLNKSKKHDIMEAKDYSNSVWMDQYRNMAFITMIFLVSIIILIYYWLSIKFPLGLTTWILFAIVGLIIVLFNYYRMSTKRMRTSSKNFYWRK